MIVDVEPVPYTTILLHCLKYPSKGVHGLLLGSKKGDTVKVTGAVPLTHESSPLAPSLEVALSLVHLRLQNVIGSYFSNSNYKDVSLSTSATRLAERISTTSGFSPLVVQVVNWNLSVDFSTNCLVAHYKESEQWKEIQLKQDPECLHVASIAFQQKLHRQLIDFDNHLDKPEADFYNTFLLEKLSLAD